MESFDQSIKLFLTRLSNIEMSIIELKIAKFFTSSEKRPKQRKGRRDGLGIDI
jgi:hypothetical protein